MPYSSMAERSLVKRRVVGSSPTGAAIYCRIRLMAGRSALNAEMQVSPTETLREQPLLWHPNSVPCGVIGNISLFESEDFRFKT